MIVVEISIYLMTVTLLVVFRLVHFDAIYAISHPRKATCVLMTDKSGGRPS